MRKLIACLTLVCMAGMILLVTPVSIAEEAGDVMTLPSSLTIIGPKAFYGTSARKVVIPDGAKEIHSKAFGNCNLSELVLPASLLFIAEDAFDINRPITVSVPVDCYAYDRCIELGLIKKTPEASLDHHTYRLIDEGMTWNEAKAYCEAT